jgi:hypothetical protein
VQNRSNLFFLFSAAFCNIYLFSFSRAALLLSSINAQTCFETRFPRVLGGTLGDTYFFAMDFDSAGNLAVGGSTSDSGVA